MVPAGLPRRGGLRREEGAAVTRCVSEGYSHDFPVDDSVQAYCQEHGVRIVWKSPVGFETEVPAVTAADPADEPAAT